MAIFNMGKKNKQKLHTGSATQIESGGGTIYARESKTVDLLNRLRQTYDVFTAIELLADEHPDVSMARQMLLSLSNQGGKIEFSGGRSKKILEEWEKFASKMNGISSTGLDGFILQATDSFITRTGIGYEIVIEKDLSDIKDVYLVHPKTLMWKLNSDNQTYTTFQHVNGKEIDLSKANFRWIPFNPNIGSPKGTFLFKSAISAADMQLEFFSSSQIVLYRVGMPRYKVTIDLEKIMAIAPADIAQDSTGIKQKAFTNEIIGNVKANLRSIGVKNDFVITSDTNVETIGGQSAYFQGIDAYASIIDTQMLNALKVLGTLMNRHQNGGSYALSTVEFKAIVDMLEPVQRAIKRMVEDIARVWLQVKGYNVTVKYTPNPIEWQTFKDKIEYQLSNQEYWRRAEEYGHVSPDEATQKTIGNDSAYNPTEKLFAYVKNAKTENLDSESNNDDEKDGEE